MSKFYLNKKSVYLCGPLHACHDDGAGWRDKITPRLLKYGLTVEDPTKKTVDGVGEVGDDKARFQQLLKEKRFDDAKEAFWPIVRKDLRCVDKADFLIFYYDASIPTVGTWHELVTASNQKKPILLVYDETQLEKFNIWVLTFIKSGCIFSNWEDMFEYLNKIDNGEFNTSHWTL
jgi:nucleoside 2-deoxyribosyltransferase